MNAADGVCANFLRINYVDLVERCVGLWIVRLGATLFGAFGCIALLLAVVGLGVSRITVAGASAKRGEPALEVAILLNQFHINPDLFV